MPETVLRTDADLPFGTGSLQRFVPFDVDEHYFTLLEEARHGVLRTICCFDLLANSADRKGGHCLVGEDADGGRWTTAHVPLETKLRP